MKDDEIVGMFAGHPMTYGKVHSLLIKAGIIDESGNLTDEYRTEPETVPFNEIQPGDLLNIGLALKVDLTGEDDFWVGEPNITFLDINDGYYAPTIASLENKQLTVAADRGSNRYNEVVINMINEQLSFIKDKVELIETLVEFLNVQNKK